VGPGWVSRGRISRTNERSRMNPSTKHGSAPAPAELRDVGRAQRIWFKIPEHPAVLRGDISPDQLRSAARQGRCRVLWFSSHSLRVHRDALDDIERSGKPMPT